MATESEKSIDTGLDKRLLELVIGAPQYNLDAVQPAHLSRIAPHSL